MVSVVLKGKGVRKGCLCSFSLGGGIDKTSPLPAGQSYTMSKIFLVFILFVQSSALFPGDSIRIVHDLGEILYNLSIELWTILMFNFCEDNCTSSMDKCFFFIHAV